jgi:hypothetical protein
MPRGNDSSAALSELADKFGRGVGNAEELIEATMAQRSQLLSKAEMLPVNGAATQALDKSKLKGPNGEKVVDAKVHGDITVIVYEDDRGAFRQAALDAKGNVSKGGRNDAGVPQRGDAFSDAPEHVPSSADKPPAEELPEQKAATHAQAKAAVAAATPAPAKPASAKSS